MRPEGNEVAERIVVGAMLSAEHMVWTLRDRLKPDMFTDAFCRSVYQTILSILDDGKSLGVSLVLSRLPEPEDRLRAETLIYNAKDDAGQAPDFADAIISAWRHRKAREIAQGFLKSLNDQDADVDIAINAMSDQVQDLVGRVGSETRSFGAIVGKVRAAQREAYVTKSSSGYQTGLCALDDILGAIMPGRLTVIGGSPGAGKSILGYQILQKVAAERGRTMYFQRDMGQSDVVNRAISMRTGFRVAQIEQGDFNLAEWDIVEEASKAVSGFDIELDTVSTTVEQIISAAKAKHRNGGVSMILVDHLRKYGTSRKAKDKWEVYERVSGGLKELSVALNVPVVVLSQITRLSQRKDVPIPEMGDLDGGGALEQDADTALILFNKAKWILKEKLNGRRPVPGEDHEGSRAKWADEYFRCVGKVEAHLVKHRLAAPDTRVMLTLNGRASRFED